MRFGLKVDDKDVRRKLVHLEREAPRALVWAGYQEMVPVFAQSQKECPVDTGTLKKSGLLAVARIDGGPAIVVSYGTEYALAVHFRYKQFLSEPFERAVPGMPARIANRAGALLSSGQKVPALRGRSGR